MFNVLWICAVAAFLVIEAVTYQMVSIWFVAGAVGGLIAALFNASFGVQMTVFIAVSAILLIALRPIALRANKSEYKTNAEAAIGKTAMVTEQIDNAKGTGAAKLGGMVWTARSDNGNVIEVGKTVTIERIEGVKLIVD